MGDRFRFRAWQKSRKRYLYDFEEDEYFGDALIDDDMVVEQCTGLKDKNGKLIYEGDILKSSFKNKESESDCLPVYYNKNQFSVGFNGGDAGWFSDYFVGEIEIVGNIHETPELLEG